MIDSFKFEWTDDEIREFFDTNWGTTIAEMCVMTGYTKERIKDILLERKMKMIEPYTGQFKLSSNGHEDYQFYSSRDSLKFSSEKEGHYDFAAIYVRIDGERDKTLEATARMMAMSGVMYEMMRDYVDNGTKVSLDRMKEILEYIETDT